MARAQERMGERGGAGEKEVFSGRCCHCGAVPPLPRSPVSAAKPMRSDSTGEKRRNPFEGWKQASKSVRRFLEAVEDGDGDDVYSIKRGGVVDSWGQKVISLASTSKNDDAFQFPLSNLLELSC
jgi:hypothetical protein